MRTRKRWSDLSRRQRRLVVGGGSVEAVATIAALVDLVRRPADQVRGPKLLWAVLLFVQPFGPVAYFTRGIRRR